MDLYFTPEPGRTRYFGQIAACAVLVGLIGASCSADGAPAAPEEEITDDLQLAFTDVTALAGLSSFRHVNGAAGDRWFPESMGAGGGFIDFDGDGWLDILLAGGGTWPGKGEPVPALKLYRNNGDGTFTDATQQAGLDGVHSYSFGISAADYDNDGDEDFFLSNLGEDMLFRNEGGRFVELGKQAGVGGGELWTTSSMFFDADQDGHLDLYVGAYVDWSPATDLVCTIDGSIRSYCTPQLYTGVPGRFYHNNGDGTFSDWTDRAGFGKAQGKNLGVVATDFNRDGWTDVILANDTQPNELYVNQGDGTFIERGVYSGIAYDENGIARAGMGVDVGVVDTTGEETMFVGNFSKEMIGVFRYQGNGLFKDRATLSRIGQPSLPMLTFGLFLFDADLDGDLDLFAANGHVQPEVEETQEGIRYAQPPHLFLNDGNGFFSDEAPRIGGPLLKPLVARGAAFGDYDRDGDLDVLVTENNGSAHLYRNDVRNGQTDPGSGPNYLRVQLRGQQVNRDGLGSKIEVVTGGRRQVRLVRTGSSFMSSIERTATFGLGTTQQVDSLIIRWISGRVDRFVNVSANQQLLVSEGADAYIEMDAVAMPVAVVR